MVGFLFHLISKGNENDAYIWLLKYWINTARMELPIGALKINRITKCNENWRFVIKIRQFLVRETPSSVYFRSYLQRTKALKHEMWNLAHVVKLGLLRAEIWVQPRVTTYDIHRGRNGSGKSLCEYLRCVTVNRLSSRPLKCATALTWQRTSHPRFQIRSKSLTFIWMLTEQGSYIFESIKYMDKSL
jgi:hypothetical protein